MTKFIHELLLHVVVVVAGVMFWMGVLMVFCMGVLMMNWLCCFLWLWFGWLRSPPGPDPRTAHPHVSCKNQQNQCSWSCVGLLCSLLALTVTDNTTSYVCCVIPMSMRCSTIQERRTSLSQMLNMADPNPSVTLIFCHLPCPITHAFALFVPSPFFSRHCLCT